MKLSEKIENLKLQVRERMGEKRFLHTLGVAEFAYRMALDLSVENPLDYYIAGLLHDIAKELPREEQLRILKIPSNVYQFQIQDLQSPTLFHGFCAPYIIERDFPEFAKENILYAVAYHTVGREEMTLFEKVIFLADYMEFGREYPDCVYIRNYYLEQVRTRDDKEKLINECMLFVLDKTLAFLENRDYFISPRTHLTRNSIFAELSRV